MQFKMAAVIRFDLNGSEKTRLSLYNYSSANEMATHQHQKEKGLRLYAITSMQKKPCLFLRNS